MGFRADEAIAYIEVAPPFSRPNLNAKTILAPRVATFGPVYWRQMMEFLKTDSISQNLTAAIEACKAHGIDVEMWAAVKAFVCMAGAAAEARFTNRSLSEIAKGYECESDLRDATRPAQLRWTHSSTAARRSPLATRYRPFMNGALDAGAEPP